MKTLALSELRRVAERFKRPDPSKPPRQGRLNPALESPASRQPTPLPQTGGVGGGSGLVERIPWRVWYVSANNGDVILGEPCVTLAVYTDGPGAFPSRLVQFLASGQIRRLRDCCILRADDFILRI